MVFCFKLTTTWLTELFINNAEKIFKLIILWRWRYFLFCLIFFIDLFFTWLFDFWIHILVKILMSKLHHLKSRFFQILSLLIFWLIYQSKWSSCLTKNYIFVWGHNLTWMNIILEHFMIFIFFKCLTWRIWSWLL